MIKFPCPHCSQYLEADDAMANTEFVCPACNQDIKVPAESPLRVAAGCPPAATSPAGQAARLRRYLSCWRGKLIYIVAACAIVVLVALILTIQHNRMPDRREITAEGYSLALPSKAWSWEEDEDATAILGEEYSLYVDVRESPLPNTAVWLQEYLTPLARKLQRYGSLELLPSPADYGHLFEYRGEYCAELEFKDGDNILIFRVLDCNGLQYRVWFKGSKDWTASRKHAKRAFKAFRILKHRT